MCSNVLRFAQICLIQLQFCPIFFCPVFLSQHPNPNTIWNSCISPLPPTPHSPCLPSLLIVSPMLDACPVVGEGFFFGLATAPAHVEDDLEDTWVDFARGSGGKKTGSRVSDLQSYVVLIGCTFIVFTLVCSQTSCWSVASVVILPRPLALHWFSIIRFHIANFCFVEDNCLYIFFSLSFMLSAADININKISLYVIIISFVFYDY